MKHGDVNRFSLKFRMPCNYWWCLNWWPAGYEPFFSCFTFSFVLSDLWFYFLYDMSILMSFILCISECVMMPLTFVLSVWAWTLCRLGIFFNVSAIYLIISYATGKMIYIFFIYIHAFFPTAMERFGDLAAKNKCPLSMSCQNKAIPLQNIRPAP